MNKKVPKPSEAQKPRGMPPDLWSEKERMIIEKFIAGFSREEITLHTGFSPSTVNNVVKRFGLKELVSSRDAAIKQEILLEKVPILKEITELSLTAIRDYLIRLEDPLFREEKLSSIQDVRCLTSISKELNEMLRLELGQATSNVKHEVEMSLDETKKVFEDLRKVDKVFDYPLEEIEFKEIEEDAQETHS